MIPSVHSGRLRTSSVSSMRSTKVPPCWRTKSQLYSAARALPTWKYPVGDGAKRAAGSGVGHTVRLGIPGAGGLPQGLSGVSLPLWRWRRSGNR